MKKQTAVIAAVLAAGLAALGSGHAYGPAEAQQAGTVNTYCFDAYYDGGGAGLVYEEICNRATFADGIYANEGSGRF